MFVIKRLMINLYGVLIYQRYKREQVYLHKCKYPKHHPSQPNKSQPLPSPLPHIFTSGTVSSHKKSLQKFLFEPRIKDWFVR
jgi:hypothetical protein